MPVMDEILENYNGSTLFTSKDLFSGNRQIRMDKKCKDKTTFRCRYATFKFEVIPFKLMKAPTTFQLMIYDLLQHLDSVQAYIDDIVIHPKTKQNNFTHLCKTLRLIANHGLTVRLSMNFFMMPEIVLLGHIVHQNGIRAYQKGLAE